MSDLKVFHGFQADMVSDFTGLTKSEIRSLREAGIVCPEKTRDGYRFTFQDILILKLSRIMKAFGIRFANIRQAYQFLKDITPERCLTSYQLYLHRTTHEILYIGSDEDGEKFTASANRCGQLLMQNLLTVIPVGGYLESLRTDIVSFDDRLHKSLESKKRIPFDQVKAKYKAS